MKKDISLLFTKIIYLLFIVATIIVCFIVYKDIDNKVAIGFIGEYAIFVFLFLLYIIFTAILNSRKLKWKDIKGRLFKFSISFITILVLGYIFDYFFRSSKIDLFRNFSIAIGTAFGISFNDIIFSKKK